MQKTRTQTMIMAMVALRCMVNGGESLKLDGVLVSWVSGRV